MAHNRIDVCRSRRIDPRSPLESVRFAAVLVAAAVAIALGTSHVRAQQSATLRATSHQTGDQLVVDLVADGVHNLGGFEAVLAWNNSSITFTDVKPGSLLGATGRFPDCPAPTIDSQAVRLTCFTFNVDPTKPRPANATEIPGADGSGPVAEAHFRVLKGGKVSLHLSHVILADARGSQIPSQSADLDVTVHAGGASSRIGAVVIGVVVALVFAVAIACVAVVYRRRRAAHRAVIARSTAATRSEDTPERYG